LLRRDDGDDFKLHEVFPTRDPFLQESRVVALHQLKAAAKVRLDPTINVIQTLRHHPPALAVSPVNGRGVSTPETLYYHKQHADTSASGWYQTATAKNGAFISDLRPPIL
jgi:hypothetical protein